MKNNKFSIIIPIYNVEKYLEKCLNSILNQSYKNFEIIAINDGSKDSSKEILNKYKNNENIKIINQENKGLSAARNEGLKHVTGDYILFVDSDDFIEKDLLKILNDNINDEEIIRFQIRTVNENNQKTIEYKEKTFNKKSGKQAFREILNYHFIELACCYAYKKDYFINSKYKFNEDLYHEDYGLIPLVIIKSNKVKSIDFLGYNYLIRDNSITNNSNYEKTLKKAQDTLIQYKLLINLDEDIYYKSFLANSVILKLETLSKEDYKQYLKEIKKENVINNILSDTLKRKIKKIILKISPKIYFKMR